MASHSNEDAINERRLKPIYDNLDNGNYKAAIQAADRVLKKHKELHCAKVLKALALLRLYKVEECEELAKTVVALKPTDEPTLQALSMCFKEMNKVELIVEVFANAVKSQPSEEYYTHLFMALVRTEDFKRQQQTAMSLYKLVPKNAFYFWAVISAVMQAQTSENSLGQKMLLPLAERMVEKMIKEGKVEVESELNLYLVILGMLGKHQKALEITEDELGKKLLVAEIPSREERVAEIYFKMEKWDKAHQAYRDLLSQSPDNWMYYSSYMTSGLTLQENGCKSPQVDSGGDNTTSNTDTNGSIESTPVDDVVSKMALFILERISTEDDKKKRQIRGPYLAQLELISRLEKMDRLEEYPMLGNTSDAIFRFFQVFGDKTCCFTDLVPYLYNVKEDERPACLQRIEEEVALSDKDGEMVHATTVKQMQRHLTFLKIGRFYGCHDTLGIRERQRLSVELFKRYREGLKLGNNLLETDLQYSDEYLLMSVHLLLDICQETGDESLIWQCLVLLKIGHKHSRSSHHYKLLLMRLYCLCGIFSPVPELYDGLDIKHMQQDTLGYNALKYAKSLGQLSSAAHFYKATLRYFINGRKEVSEFMIASYRFGTYHKIPEFLTFSKKIKYSLHFAHTAIEKKLLDILTDSEKEGKTFTEYVRNMEINPTEDTIEWSKVTDQRDLDVMVNWSPPSRQLSPEDRAASLRQEMAWVRLRDLLLRLLAVAIDLRPSTLSPQQADPNSKQTSAGGENKENFDALKEATTLLGAFEERLKSCKEDELRKEFPVQGPPVPLTAEYLDGSLGTIMAHSFHIVKEAYQMNQSGTDEVVASLQDSFCVHCEELRNHLQESVRRSRRGLVKEVGERKIFDRHILTEVTLLTETVIYVIYLMGLACRTLSSLKNKLSKRNKKRKNAPKPLPPCIAKFQSLLEDLVQIQSGVENAVTDLEANSQSLDMTQLTLTYPRGEDEEFTENEAELWKTIAESYKESCDELTELLKSKRECLGKLKL